MGANLLNLREKIFGGKVMFFGVKVMFFGGQNKLVPGSRYVRGGVERREVNSIRIN